MLIHNNVTENVVTIVIARVFKDIRTLVRKQPSVALPPSRSTRPEKEIIQLQEDNNVLNKQLFELSD
jgi:hypothetical protein